MAVSWKHVEVQVGGTVEVGVMTLEEVLCKKEELLAALTMLDEVLCIKEEALVVLIMTDEVKPPKDMIALDELMELVKVIMLEEETLTLEDVSAVDDKMMIVDSTSVVIGEELEKGDAMLEDATVLLQTVFDQVSQFTVE